MVTVDLGGAAWRLHEMSGGDWSRDDIAARLRDRPGIAASVPGSIHDDLWRSGLIADPYAGRNSLAAEWVADRTWAYTCTFAADSAWHGQHARLRCEGIDYEGRVIFNGIELGRHIGMSTPAIFEIDDALEHGASNELVIIIAPAPHEQDQLGRTSLVRTRKTRMGYGWDFCPRIINVGLWDAVSIELSGPVRIDDVWVRPRVDVPARRAQVPIFVEAHAWTAGDAVVDVQITSDDRPVCAITAEVTLTAGTQTIELYAEIDGARLWWPNGYGDQPLYRADVVVRDASNLRAPSHEASVVFGLREIEVVPNETPDASALPYTFVVNGRRIYLNGWNWVPLDALYGRVQPQRLDAVLELAARAHVNLLRVNGVGVIERQDFYERCDRLGLLVWQEFVVTSSEQDRKPSEDPAYLAEMTDEAMRIVPRRRNHASLAVWCAGNELEGLDKLPLDDREPLIAALKNVVALLDPDRHWLPTSPTGRKPFNGLSSIRRDPDGLHDVHGPWLYEGLEDQYTLYNAGTSLLHSEFGAEGLTNIECLRELMPPEELSLDRLQSATWRHLSAWWLRPQLWREWFGPVRDLQQLIDATQMLQAEAARYAIESNRRRIPRNSGSLPWQFNEPYPMAAGTSAVDYHGRPKALYSAVAEAYSPVSVTARYDRLAWGGHRRFDAEVWVVDATARPAGGVVEAFVRAVDGSVLSRTRMTYEPSGGRPVRVGTVTAEVADAAGGAFLLDLRLVGDGGETLATNRVCFSSAADLSPLIAVPATELAVGVREQRDRWEAEITNTGPFTAMYVRIADARAVTAAGQAMFEANHFCVLPGETRFVRVDWRHVDEADRRLSIRGWNTAYHRHPSD